MLRAIRVVAGFGLLVCGVAMLVLPGPGILAILGALAMLAAEFVWARRLLTYVKRIGAGRFSARRGAGKDSWASR